MWVLPAVLVLAIAGMAGLNYLAQPAATPTPPPPPARPAGLPDSLSNPQDASRKLQELAKRSQGDWQKLTPDEQKFLNGLSAGHGQQMLKTSFSSQSKNKRAR
jgi:hypothetical protein